MKYIRKSGCPHWYAKWCADVEGTDKADFREIPAKERRALLAALLDEQGALCAYTMRRIDSNSAHIEHIKPQSRCRAEQAESDLNYDNLVACFPREGMRAAYRYGAQKKDNWWENGGADFVSPLHPACEHRFRFALDGGIFAEQNLRAAKTTIRVLALDHESLCEDRRRAIEEFLYGPAGDEPLSMANARRAYQGICERRSDGSYHEFCVALKAAIEAHTMALRKRAQRRKALRKKG